MNNNKKSTSLIAALSLLLPMSAFAQTGTPGSSGSSGQNRSGSQDPSSSSSSTPSRSSQLDTNGTSGVNSSGYGQMSGSNHSQVMLITEDQLKDGKVTAENLRGKKIVDRDGQVIGTVKEVGLGSVMQSGSRSNQTYGSTTSSQGSTGSTSTHRSTGSSSSQRSTGSTSASNAPSTATGAYSMNDVSSSSSQNDQVVLYVKLDDKLEIQGKDLAVIPASQVQYDREKKELKMQVGRSELASQLKLSSTSNR